MAPGFAIKQGGQLSLAIQLVQDDGTPVPITGATLASQIRDSLGNLAATASLTITNGALGQFTLAAVSDSTWPLGNLKCDLLITLNGATFYSDTFTVAVSAPVTVPP